MSKYGQYCPIAQALEVVGDRWTLLIIRDMLTGTTQFNDLERGLPGLSRGLLAARLRQLQAAGVVEKRFNSSGRKTTEYHLTQAGQELQTVINALLLWGTTWAFRDPSQKELDPLLLMWWMRGRVDRNELPENRVAVQFNFRGARVCTFWLILTREDVTVCLTDPAYDIDLLVEADLSSFFKLWLGVISYDEAVEKGDINIEGVPQLVNVFPNWFMWSPAREVVRALKKPD
ncbi:MAG: transcriptional regulator [Chloroflexota bacterium]|nr:transcriptional regulator [Chloroflexota bacterium]NOG62615.1 helix-turn-helix transcriptional regulator [Chloroflexota bacterium]GIK63176.1 MAG: transcriptional regulator [Chloroflexota bacterium]